MFGDLDWLNWDWFWPIPMEWGQLSPMELTIRLGMATLLGALIGLERERLDRAAGLRTHALVSVASALIMVVSTYGYPLQPDGTIGTHDPGRIAAQVVSGIGFLGAGVIIFRDNTVRGLTTAATLWAVAGVGLAAGSGLYAPAIVGTIFMLIVQAGMKPVERKLFAKHARQHRIMLKVDHGEDVLQGVQFATAETPVRLRSLQFDHAPGSDLDTVELTLIAKTQQDVLDLVNRLRKIEAVHTVHYQRRSSQVERRIREEGRSLNEEDDDEGNGTR